MATMWVGVSTLMTCPERGWLVIVRSGRVILAEHSRNVANFLAFGPGFLHFLPYSEWLRLGRTANLRVVREGRITPFVRYLVLEK